MVSSVEARAPQRYVRPVLLSQIRLTCSASNQPISCRLAENARTRALYHALDARYYIAVCSTNHEHPYHHLFMLCDNAGHRQKQEEWQYV